MMTQIRNALTLALSIFSVQLTASWPILAQTQPAEQNLIAENSRLWQFKVFGTEPFWGVTVAPSGITYSTLDGTQTQFPFVQPLHATARPQDLVLFFNLGDNNSLTLVQNNCSDRMSDQTHKYMAILVLGDQVYEGCANPR